MKFGFGSSSGQSLVGRYGFGLVEVWVGSTSDGVTVTRFGSGMGSVHFGSGEIGSPFGSMSGRLQVG